MGASPSLAWLAALGIRCALVLAAGACSKRASTEELVASLRSTGLHVDRKEDLEPQPEWVGGELGVHLVLGYEEPYLAVRFTSADLSRSYCQGGQGSIPVGAWCLEPMAHPFKPEIWNKVNELRR